MYKTSNFVGNTPLVRLKRCPAPDRGARQRHPGQAGRQQSGRFGQGPAGAVDDPSRRTARRHQAGRYADRSDLRQHRHRAGDGGGDGRLPDDPGHAGEPERRAPPDDARFRRRTGADAADGGMELARDVAEKCATKGAASSSTSSPIRTTAGALTKAPGRKSGARRRAGHAFRQQHGTTGTIMGVSRFLKEQNPDVCIVGCQPEEGSRFPGIRKWAGSLSCRRSSTGRASIASNRSARRCRG